AGRVLQLRVGPRQWLGGREHVRRPAGRARSSVPHGREPVPLRFITGGIVTPMIPLAKLLDDVRRALRRETAVAVLLGALCAVPGALLAAWIIGLIQPWRGPGIGPLLLDILAIGAAGLLSWLGVRRWIRALDERAIAEDAERTAGMPQGAVHGVLELSRNVPEGTSAALARRAEVEVSRRFTDRELVAPALRLRARQRRRVATLALIALSLTTAVLAFV